MRTNKFCTKNLVVILICAFTIGTTFSQFVIANDGIGSTHIITNWNDFQSALENAQDGEVFDLSALTSPTSALTFNGGNNKTVTIKGNKSLINNVAFLFGSNNNITINNLNIKSANYHPNGGFVNGGISPLNFDGTGNVLNLSGENTVTNGQTTLSSPYGAAVGIGNTATLIIKTTDYDPDASLTAIGGSGGAGIGGCRGKNGGTITITSGRITASAGSGGSGIGSGAGVSGLGLIGGSITITGGTITANGSDKGSGIGGGSGASGGSITITGGIITAKGNGLDGGAGIGSGGARNQSSVSGGTIIISGGILTATGSGGGSGIGGGYNASSGTITINGGTITAQGGVSTIASGGAGIGGGTDKAGSAIISGGKITATGATGASGIGGGSGSGGGNITISGGTITATGGSGASGIGGGNSNTGHGGTVVITGGSIKAIRGSILAQDIGRGSSSFANSGTIKDGKGNNVWLNTVTVSGQSDAPVTSAEYYGNEYGTKDVYTDDESKLYFYLPASSEDKMLYAVVNSIEYAALYTQESNYTHKETMLFSIRNANITPLGDSFTYTGEEINNVIYNIVLNNSSLTKGTDYTESYENNINTGIAKVIITGIGNYLGIKEQVFIINKANPTVNWPTNLTAIYGQTLSNIMLPGNNIGTPGIFTWSMPGDSVGYAGTQSHNITFVPTDRDNYNTIMHEVGVEVDRALGADVVAPEANSKTLESVTLSIVMPPVNGQTVEYAYNTTNMPPVTGWQDSTIFSSLNEYTEYYFFSRSKASNNYYAGNASSGTAIRTADKTNPTGEITIKTNGWTSFLNTITFGFFFKNTVDVTVSANDTGSGVANIEYYLSETELLNTTDWDMISWISGSATRISANWKGIVYARITDNENNVAVICSSGIVLYTDSTQNTSSITFTKTSTTDLTANVTLNGNIIKEIKNGSEVIASTNYSITGDTITFKANYLNTLEASSYSLTISYNPMGESYVTGGNNEAPEETTIALTVIKADQTLTFDTVPATKTYGDSSFTVTATGQGTGTVTYTSNNTAVATVNSTTGVVTIVGAGLVTISATKETDGNYNSVTTISGTITVNKKDLTVTAVNKIKAYGETNPVFTVTYSGFVTGESISNLITLPIATCTATNTSATGNYDIIPAGGDSINYSFTYVIGTLTVGVKAPVYLPPIISSGTPNVTISTGDQDILNCALTDVDRIAIAAGADYSVQLKVNVITPSDSDKNAIGSNLGERKIGTYLDISLIKIVNGEENLVTNLTKKIKITMDIPTELIKEDRTFAVLRLHNGEIVILEDLDNNTNTYTFETDRFSTYTLTYIDKKTIIPETGEKTPIIPFVLLAILFSGTIIAFGRKRKTVK